VFVHGIAHLRFALSSVFCNRVFGWRADGAERSRSAPAAVWMGSDGSGAAPGGICSPDVGRLCLLNFEGRNGFAPVSPLRLPPVSPLSRSCGPLEAAAELAPVREAELAPGARGRRSPAPDGARPRAVAIRSRLAEEEDKAGIGDRWGPH
jgi:hypothetical protein